VIGNFDRARTEDVDRIMQQYLQDAWSPKTLLTQIVTEAAVGKAADSFVDSYVKPRFESALGRLDRAWYQRESGEWLATRELYRPTPVGKPVIFPPFWTGRPGRSEWLLRADSNNVPLLRYTGTDANGFPVDGFYRYDPSTNRVGYTQRDVDDLVANGNFALAWEERSELVWRENQMVFIPPLPVDPAMPQILNDAAKYFVGETLKDQMEEEPNPPDRSLREWYGLLRDSLQSLQQDPSSGAR
jgi:hypothetical protein